METTTILPTQPTSGAVISSGAGHNGYGYGYNRDGDFGVKDLLINQAVADGTRDAVAATHNDTNHILREVSSVGRDSINVGNNNYNSLANGLSDIRASGERQFGEVREKIASTAAAAAIAAKDIELRVVSESCHTREKSAEQFASLQLQAEKNAAKAAECCCEIKELIRVTESNRVRDENNLLQMKLIACKAA